jgi:hypothetical protein
MERLRVRRHTYVLEARRTTSTAFRIALAICAAAAGCQDGGRTEASVAELTVEPGLMAEEGCVKDPEELEELDQACFALPCVCGSHCNQQSGRCEFECILDDDCAAGQICNFEGYCLAPGETPPTSTLTMEVDPLGFRLRPDRGAEIEPVTFEIALSTPVTPPDEIGVLVVSTAEGSPLPTIQCTEGGAFAESCELTGPWDFAGTPATATAQVHVKLPAAQADQTWTLEFRSNQTINPVVSVSTEILPLDPVPPDGYYTGSLFTDEAPTGERYPVQGVFADGKLVLVDDARVVSEDATIRVVAPYAAVLVPWARGQSADPDEHATASIAPTAPEQVRDTGALVGSIQLTGTGGPVSQLWRYELLPSDQEVPFPTCGSGAPPCGSGLVCSADVARCLPANESTAASPSAFVDVSAGAWFEAAQTAAPLYVRNRQHDRRAEVAVCHDPDAPGDYLSTRFMTVGSGADQAETGELACEHGSGSQAFPFLTVPRGFEMSEGEDVDNLLESCVVEIGAPPNHETALAKARCLSPGRFFYAFGNTLNSTWSSVAQRMTGFLLRNWFEAHELVAQLGLLESIHSSALASDDEDLSSPDTNSVLNTLDRGWDLLLDDFIRTRVLQVPPEALADPDYRAAPNMPLVYWSFNQESPAQNPMTVPNVVPAPPDTNLNITGSLKVWNLAEAVHNTMVVLAGGGSSAVCRTLSDRNHNMAGDYTAMANVRGLVVGTSEEKKLLFRQTSDSFRVSAAHVQGVLTPGGERRDFINLEVKVGPNVANMAFHRGPDERLAGTYALVQKGNQLRLYGPPATGTGVVLLGTTIVAPIPPNIGASAQLEINCAHPGLWLDDVMLFTRALEPDELAQIADGNDQNVDTTLPLEPIREPENPAFHDGVALQIEQTAHRHLSLLANWLDEENLQTYETCQLGQSSAARTAALVRTGRTIRRIINAQTIADQLVADIDLGALPWGVRYRDARAAAHAARARVAAIASQIRNCENPLGIADSDLPMYYKSQPGHLPQDAYFGSSKFLLQQAEKHIVKAGDRLEAARQAWLNQRTSVYQARVTQNDRAARIAQIKAEHEVTLTRLCGKPAGAGGTPILDSVLTPEGVDYDALRTCFIRTPQCNPNQKLESMPASCLRGQIGEQVLALQGSLLATTSARNAWERADQQVDEMGDRCCHKQRFYAENEDITADFQGTVKKWRKLKGVADVVAAGARATAECASGDTWFSFGGHCAAALVAGVAEMASIYFQEEIALAEASHQAVVERRANQEDVRDCWFEWDQHKDVIDAQIDAMTEASHAILGVRLELENMQSEAIFVAEQAQAAIAVVNDLHVDAPQHHFWFDAKIQEYRWSFGWAKRLTYLAMRSAEYELQQSLGLRGAILRAEKPFDLEQLHDLLFAAVANGTANGHEVDFQPLVLSLRQQILHVAPSGPYSTPAEKVQAEIRAFQEYLQSNGTIIYRQDGRRLGRGFRFSLQPFPETANLCAERFWRLSASLQFQQAPPNGQSFLVQHTNTFASTQCGSEEETLTFARTRPHENLLLPPDDGRIDVLPLSGNAERITGVAVQGAYNRSRQDMEDDPPDTGLTAFAGRGLYGDFVLVFPDDSIVQGFDITKLEDILLRFQLVAGSENPPSDVAEERP